MTNDNFFAHLESQVVAFGGLPYQSKQDLACDLLRRGVAEGTISREQAVEWMCGQYTLTPLGAAQQLNSTSPPGI